jgi:hypothetical protein
MVDIYFDYVLFIRERFAGGVYVENTRKNYSGALWNACYCDQGGTMPFIRA